MLGAPEAPAQQANSWPHYWWERSISAAFSDVTNEPDAAGKKPRS